MNIFAIGDLHLAGGTNKPMDVFGENWDRHFERVTENWTRSVCDGDIVLIPGDISWAMHLADAMEDIEAIAALPGRKILLRGNHDYWWSSVGRLRAVLPKNVYALQNDSVSIDGFTVAGSRGWTCPGNAAYTNDDDKIYQRELIRLGLSLEDAKKHGGADVAMLHYPPFDEKHRPTGFSALITEYGVKQAVYGHLHSKAARNGFEGERDGVTYSLCSADHIEFAPRLILSI